MNSVRESRLFGLRGYANRGFTLVELMVVVVIIAILSSIAIPSYTQYITRSRRSVAKTVLLQVADRQEQFFADNKTYANDLTDLGYADDGFAIDEHGTVIDVASADRQYLISLTNTAAMTFTVNAAPQLTQAARDASCMTLTLTHTGIRDQTGPSDDCW